MLLLPAAMPVLKPVAALTVALAGMADVQADLALTSCEEPSLYVAMAVNCWPAPMATVAVAGVTARLDRVAPGKPRMGSRPWSPPPPQPARAAMASRPAETISGFRYRLKRFIVFLCAWQSLPVIRG
ncbi:hypothetical protein D3C81_1901510 [compost metagenome]